MSNGKVFQERPVPMSEKILIVDDEEDLNELIAFNLERSGFDVVCAFNGKDAIQMAAEHKPNLVILDLMLPDVDGLEVYRTLQKDPSTASIPILMLTAKADEMDRVVGLELGADDYVTKPFSPRELVLRIKAITRRTKILPSSEELPPLLEYGPIKMDIERYEVMVNEREVVLTSTEFRLLQELLQKRGRVLTRNHLLENVWGYAQSVTDRTVDTHIKRLRQKLGSAGSAYIETIRGVGYRFADSEIAQLPAEEDREEELGLI